MLKFVLLLIVLVGCSDNKTTNQIKDFKSSSDTLQVGATKNKITQPRPRLFDNKEPFQVRTTGNRIETNTTDKDTIKCAKWTLTPQQITTIIKNSEKIDGTVWDLSFDFLSCSVHGTIIQNNVEYPFTVNAGSFALVNSGDTTIIYGDYNKKDVKYFLSSPQK